MDPLSAVASIITIIGAAGAVARLPDKIASIRAAPQLIGDVQEEAALIYEDVLETQTMLQQAKVLNLAAPQSLSLALNRLNSTIERLKAMAEEGLRTESLRPVQQVRCYRLQKPLKLLLERMQRERAALHSGKATLMLELNNRIMFFVRLSSYALGSMIFSSHQMIQHRFDRLEAAEPQALTRRVVMAVASDPRSKPTSYHAVSASYRADIHGRRLENASSIGPYIFDNEPDTCPPNCRCHCHTLRTFQTPSFLSSVIGRLLVGYNAVPWQTSSCNELHCRKTATHTTLLYAFPTWLFQSVVVCSLWGSDLSMRMMNVRDRTWRFQGLVMSTDQEMAVSETQRQLRDRELSVRDVTANGATALHLALYSRLLEVAKLLVTKGADVHYKDRYGRSPYMIAWERRWTRKESQHGGLTENFFANQAHLIDFYFTELHQAYLGITDSNFHELVTIVPRQFIDKGDKQGRTALSWAAGCNDREAVIRLLSSNADPNKASVDGWTPLHYAAEADGTEALEELLRVGVFIDAETETGRTPLHIACANRQVPRMMELLIEKGADVNKKARNGFTALQHTFAYGSVSMTKTLLNAGARCGIELVNYAIYHNAHESLELLLAKWDDDNFDQDDADDDEDTFHYVVHYASIPALKVLTAIWPASIDLTSKAESGRATIEEAVWRRDNNVEWSREYTQTPDRDPGAWFRAFEDMVDAIQIRQWDRGTPIDSDEDDLVEDYYSSEESFFDDE